MKLFNIELEMMALATIAGSKKKIAAAQLFANLSPDYFHDDNSKAIFRRIQLLAKKEGEFPTLHELLTDPLLTTDQKQDLKEAKILKKQASIEKLHKRLNIFRQVRTLYYSAEHVLTELDKDKVDIEALTAFALEETTKATTSTIRIDDMISIGHKDNSKDIFEDILNPKKLDFIPTGFYTFDEINGGLLPGSLMVVAANSGGGKSTMANQIAINVARGGYKVRMIPLEMTKREMMQRVISNVSEVPMTKFVKGNLTDKEKKKVRKAWKSFNKDCMRLKGQYNIWDPEEDITIEQALNVVKPFNDDIVIIDYIGLLKGVDGDNAWQALGNAARTAKIWAKNNNKIVILLAQLSDDGAIRYSKAIKDHANLMWTWAFTDENRETGIIDIVQQKARNQDPFDFQLGIEFKTMRIFDLDKRSRDKKVKTRSAKGEKVYRKTKQASDDLADYI